MASRSALPLRDYQHDLINRVREILRTHRRVVLQSPTGSGKTVLTAHMIQRAAERGLSSWFLVHRRELLDQTSAALWAMGLQHGVISGGRSQTADAVQVATIQTLAGRFGRLRPPDFVIIDEAHHTAAPSYRKLMEHCARSWVVGLTATPCRTDGRGLDDLFDALVEGPTVSWLTERGYLARYRIIAPPAAMDLSNVRIRAGDFARGELEAVVDQGTVVGDAVQHYRRHVVGATGGRPPSCLVYCVSRAHARHVEEAYRAAGVDARYCAGDTPKAERDELIRGFRFGRPPVIVSVDLFGEGLDAPGLQAVQLLRPTQSLSLHLQQVGRALRPEGDKVALILDHTGNTWRHGLPDDEREWALEGEKRRKKKAEDAGPALRHCDGCFAIYAALLRACPVCGQVTQVQRQELPDQVDGELHEVDPEEHRRRRRQEEGRARTLEELVALAKSRQYKPAWAGIRWAVRTGMDKIEAIREAQKLWRESA